MGLDVCVCFVQHHLAVPVCCTRSNGRAQPGALLRPTPARRQQQPLPAVQQGRPASRLEAAWKGWLATSSGPMHAPWGAGMDLSGSNTTVALSMMVTSGLEQLGNGIQWHRLAQ